MVFVKKKFRILVHCDTIATRSFIGGKRLREYFARTGNEWPPGQNALEAVLILLFYSYVQFDTAIHEFAFKRE